MSDDTNLAGDLVQVPDFRGLQALNAWLAGHDVALLLEGPNPDSPEPLLHGIVVAQAPQPGQWLCRWDVVTVWLANSPGLGGVREPRRPHPPMLTTTAEIAAPPTRDQPSTTGVTTSGPAYLANVNARVATVS